MRRPDEPSERLSRILDQLPPAEIPEAPTPVTVPPTIATSRWQVSPRAAAGAAVVLLVAVAVLVGRFVLAERSAAPVPVVAETGTGISATGDRSPFAAGATPAPATAGATPAGGQVVVHVVGRVREPGIVTVAAGSRVADAVEEAGGVREGADTAQVNLARTVVDGEQIIVPRRGDPVTVAPAPGTPGAAPGPGVAPGGDAPISLNTADQATLETLPGVGPVLAERIIEWRTANGGFTTVEELNEVSGIGEKLFAQISPKVSV